MAANAPGTGLQPTHISVTFQIVTPDRLRKIIFKLSRSSGVGADDWSVEFELDEREDPSQAFSMVAQLRVEVDHEDRDRAAATAKNGLDEDQHAQALVAADTAKDAVAGIADPEDAREDAKAVVKARNPNSPV